MRQATAEGRKSKEQKDSTKDKEMKVKRVLVFGRKQTQGQRKQTQGRSRTDIVNFSYYRPLLFLSGASLASLNAGT